MQRCSVKHVHVVYVGVAFHYNLHHLLIPLVLLFRVVWERTGHAQARHCCVGDWLIDWKFTAENVFDFDHFILFYFGVDDLCRLADEVYLLLHVRTLTKL